MPSRKPKAIPLADERPEGEPAPTRRRRSEAQQQKNEETRMRLLNAAARVIGKYGYAGCSIARVAARAKVAHGTFYLHFKSQQDLFDQLLPALGAEMLEVIGKAVRDSKSLIELEQRGLTANFDYLVQHPYLHRVTSEAELYAPVAYRQYFEELAKPYKKSLRRSMAAQSQPAFSEEQLDAVISMLLGARYYLLTRFCVQGNSLKPLTKELTETYLRFVAEGLGVKLDLPLAIAATAQAAEVIPLAPTRKRKAAGK
ncbi:MAG: TetR/AcrR family transcriptional regulator [Niveispirillum sp.]|uniref:TetR/AcrR family transcriptional regulator n=1 Tax=Niveispirillum sp. TaxID=1917217 RepID=UPI003BA839C3